MKINKFMVGKVPRNNIAKDTKNSSLPTNKNNSAQPPQLNIDNLRRDMATDIMINSDINSQYRIMTDNKKSVDERFIATRRAIGNVEDRVSRYGNRMQLLVSNIHDYNRTNKKEYQRLWNEIKRKSGEEEFNKPKFDNKQKSTPSIVPSLSASVFAGLAGAWLAGGAKNILKTLLTHAFPKAAAPYAVLAFLLSNDNKNDIKNDAADIKNAKTKKEKHDALTRLRNRIQLGSKSTVSNNAKVLAEIKKDKNLDDHEKALVAVSELKNSYFKTHDPVERTNLINSFMVELNSYNLNNFQKNDIINKIPKAATQILDRNKARTKITKVQSKTQSIKKPETKDYMKQFSGSGKIDDQSTRVDVGRTIRKEERQGGMRTGSDVMTGHGGRSTGAYNFGGKGGKMYVGATNKWHQSPQQFAEQQQMAQFMKFGALPSGFEHIAGNRGILGKPSAVAAGGAMPFGGQAGSSGYSGYSGSNFASSGSNYAGSQQYSVSPGEAPNIGMNMSGSPGSIPDDKHPLTKQRMQLGGNKLSRDQKLHFYALTLAEIGPRATKQDLAALMETPYNRGMTEKDKHITQNLTAAYYEPLRTNTGGYQNYKNYLAKLKKDPHLFARLDSAHNEVLRGSNYSKLATQNSSAHVAASARRSQTITHMTSTGETLSRKDKMSGARQHGIGTVRNTQDWVNKTQKELKSYKPKETNEQKLTQSAFVDEMKPNIKNNFGDTNKEIKLGTVRQKQMKHAGIRKRKLSNKLNSVLEYAAGEAGVEVDVWSGGQAKRGSGGKRKGSTRHDLGNAADLDLYVNENGRRRRLKSSNSKDRIKIAAFIRASTKAGATGVGTGRNGGYMGDGRLHVGFGTSATWGGGMTGDYAHAWRQGRKESRKFNLNDALNNIQQQNEIPDTTEAAKELSRIRGVASPVQKPEYVVQPDATISGPTVQAKQKTSEPIENIKKSVDDSGMEGSIVEKPMIVPEPEIKAPRTEKEQITDSMEVEHKIEKKVLEEKSAGSKPKQDKKSNENVNNSSGVGVNRPEQEMPSESSSGYGGGGGQSGQCWV